MGGRRRATALAQAQEQFVQPRSKAARQFCDELNQVVALLYALTDDSNNEEEIRLWLSSPNKALGVKRPVDLIKERKLAPLREALMGAFTAAHGG